MGYHHFHDTASKYNIPLTYFLPWKPSCFAGCISLKPPLLVPAITFLLSFYCFSIQVQYCILNQVLFNFSYIGFMYLSSNIISIIFMIMMRTNDHGEYRAVFKWLSKVITWLRLLRLVMGLKEVRQFFSQWEAKSKPIAPCTRDVSRASGELRWLLGIVIGSSRCLFFLWLVRVIALALVFRQSFENRSNNNNDELFN